MFLIYLISFIIISSIYYINLNKMYEKKHTTTQTFITLILGSIIVASLCAIKKTPALNLIINIIYFSCISFFLFKHINLRDYFFDGIMFMVLVLLDGIIYIVYHPFFTLNTSSNLLFLRILSSFTLFLINLLLNKLVFRNTIRSISTAVIIIIFATFILHIGIIGILNLEIIPINTNPDLHMVLLFTVIGIVISDLILFHYLEYIAQLHNKEKTLLLEKQKETLTTQYYENLKDKYQQQRKLIHDFDNHIQVISKAYQSNSKNAEKISQEVISNYNESLLPRYSDSEIINIIVSDKMEIAQANNIQFEFSCDPTLDVSFISDFDLITLLGNILDNAIEANLKVETDRFIKTKLWRHNSTFVLTSKNNYDNLLYRHKHLISTKINHDGVGLKNIESVIDRYYGIYDYGDDLGFFKITMAIPMLHYYEEMNSK